MEIVIKILGYANSYILTVIVFGFVLCCKQPRRKLFWLWVAVAAAIGIFLSTGFYRNLVLRGLSEGNVQTMPYILGWLITVIVIWACFRVTLLQAFFYQSLSYVLEHMIFNLRFALMLTGKTGAELIVSDVIMLAIRIVVGCGIYFILTKQLKRLDYLLEFRALTALIAAVNVCFTVLLNNWFYNNGWFSEALHIVRVLLCLFFVALPFMISAILRSKAEKQKLEQMIVDGEKQRRLSQENIDAINHKCHDLKYQVAALKQLAAEGGSTKAYTDAVNALEKDVMIYDAIAKTGYGGIDILLTEKSLLCEKKGICFTYMVDGENLKFMDEVDLYILLGNALDNAIEAVSDADAEHRIISMKVFNRGYMVMITVENYCAVPPRMVNGLPETTKKDSLNHGFGTKSIVGIAEKYGGSVKFSVENNRFVLNVFFPFIQDTKNL